MSKLSVTAERSARTVFDQAEVEVGRAVGEGGVWFPDDERVSRQHARLRFDLRAGKATIEDESRSGTFVMRKRISGIRPLAPGEVVRVGDSFFLYRFERESELSEPSVELPAIVGVSPAMRTLRRTLTLVGRSAATVVILGESGTGKELVARALHEQSKRRGAFVAVNCAAVPEALVESQFFGHVAGAFTGAKAEARGFFRAAEGGTLFLDEIGELPLLLQPKLLRALEERAVTPVGSTERVPCDVRIVAATNRDLSDRERFRADLFARISEFVLELPPLRARPEDVPPTLQHLLEGVAPVEYAPELVEALLTHDYPHNVRDLRRVATQLRVRGADRARWDLALLEGSLKPSERAVTPSATEPLPAKEQQVRPASDAPDGPAPSREELIRLLSLHRGVVADIARVTGRSRKQVYRWLDQHGLSVDDYR